LNSNLMHTLKWTTQLRGTLDTYSTLERYLLAHFVMSVLSALFFFFNTINYKMC